MPDQEINLNLDIVPEVSLQLDVEDPIVLDIKTDSDLHILPKGRELKVLTGLEAGETNTDYLLLYNIAKL